MIPPPPTYESHFIPHVPEYHQYQNYKHPYHSHFMYEPNEIPRTTRHTRVDYTSNDSPIYYTSPDEHNHMHSTPSSLRSEHGSAGNFRDECHNISTSHNNPNLNLIAHTNKEYNFKQNIFCCCKSCKYCPISIIFPPCLYSILIYKLHHKFHVICFIFNLIIFTSFFLIIYCLVYYQTNYLTEKKLGKNPVYRLKNGVKGLAFKFYLSELETGRFYSIIALIAVLFMILALNLFIRILSRYKLNIRYNFCLDIFYSICLSCCSLVQIGREIDYLQESSINSIQNV